MAEPIQQPATGANLLTQLLGQQTSTTGSSNTLAQQLQNMLTQGSTTGTNTGSSSATTSTTAELAPLIAAFTQAQNGMSPEMLTQLISSIFTEGAQKVPELTTQYANATGSRAKGNSGLQLALGDLNKGLTSQVVQSLLNYNQGSQATAGNIASNIAANTRQTQQQGQQANQTAGTTQQAQQQVGTTNTTQSTTSKQKQGVNPNMAAMVGAGGTALNFLDKKGVFDGIFGRNTGGVGGIGTTTLPASSNSLPTLTNGGGGSAGMLSSPAPSQGFLQGPAAAAPAVSPYGNVSSIGSAGGVSAPMAPIIAPNAGGITSFGGYSNPGGTLGTGDFGFGSLPTSFNAFGTAGTESLGSNLDFGSNPYGYGGSADGITGAVGGSPNMVGGFSDGLGNLGSSLGSGLSSFGDSLGGWLGGAADWIGSFFADGGQVGNRGIGSVGDTRYGAGSPGTAAPVRLPVTDIWSGTRLRNEMQAGLTPMPQTLQQGTNVQVPPGTPTGVDPTMASVMQLLPFLLGKGLGFADGGQVQTGGTPTRQRNANYMGPRLEKDRSSALNYEGYASSPAAVGSSQPAGLSPSLPMQASPVAQAATTFAQSQGDPQQQALDLFRESVARQQAAAEAYRAQAGGAGGSGGVGEGEAPGQNEADNGQAGIGPSGIASAPTGTSQAVGMVSNAVVGMPNPISMALALIASLASQVNAANQGMVSSTSGTAGDATVGSVDAGIGVGNDADSPDIGVTVSVPGLPGISTNTGGDGIGGVGVGASGGPGSGTDGGAGDSGVGGDSAGDGTSGSAGTSAGADGWADGGLVRGPGTGTSDSIPVKPRAAGGKQIHYSDGEYVIPADVVDSLGVDLFDRLVSAHHTPVNA